MRYHEIRVLEVVRETAEACSLVLDIPPDLATEFTYRPGQYLTVRVPHGIARCYSLASSPLHDVPPKVTVKRMRDGRVSNWICDHVTAGTVLEILPPAGHFTPDSLDADLLLLAGGSGITPVMSILTSALTGGTGRIVLVYANRDEESVIFADDLRRLAAAHPDRLHVTHWFDVENGPPTPDALRGLVEPYADFEAFVCGPDAYMTVVEKALEDVGVERIHVERFESLEADPVEGGRDATVEVTLDGQTHRFDWPAGTRLLDLLIGKGLNAPFSCRQGTCASCACRITEGDVDLLHNEVLEEEDFAEGYILACQAVALTDRVVVTYD